MFYSNDYIEQKRNEIAAKARKYENENPGCIKGLVYGVMWNAWIKSNERKVSPEYCM